MTTLNAKNLTLTKVHQLLKLDERFSNLSFKLLSLEPLMQEEQQEITQIRKDFRYYLNAGKVS